MFHAKLYTRNWNSLNWTLEVDRVIPWTATPASTTSGVGIDILTEADISGLTTGKYMGGRNLLLLAGIPVQETIIQIRNYTGEEATGGTGTGANFTSMHVSKVRVWYHCGQPTGG